MSVAKFDLNYLRTGEIESAEIFFRMSLLKSVVPIFLSCQGQRGRGPKNQNYPDLHRSQGGMKFATQISPLLNCYFRYQHGHKKK